jgi:hypothetical protein
VAVIAEEALESDPGQLVNKRRFKWIFKKLKMDEDLPP